MKHIALVEKDFNLSKPLAKALRLDGYSVIEFDQISTLLKKQHSVSFGQEKGTFQIDILIVDMEQEDMRLVKRIMQLMPKMEIILIASHGEINAISRVHDFARAECIAKPVDLDTVMQTVAYTASKENVYKNKDLQLGELFLKSQSRQMQYLYKSIEKIAKNNTPIMIKGAVGVGKKTIAKAIHGYSDRSDEECIYIEVSSLPAAMVEIELFGKEALLESGDIDIQKGVLEKANGSSVILSGVEELPAQVQSQILTLIRKNFFYRSGGIEQVKSNVRLIVISSDELSKRVSSGLFKKELYYELDGFSLLVPDLKDRKEDISEMAAYFLAISCEKNKVHIKQFDTQTSDVMKHFSWPGNVIQLKKICDWLSLTCDNHKITKLDLPVELQQVDATSLEQRRQMDKHDLQIWQQHLAKLLRKKLIYGEKNIQADLSQQFESVLITETLNYTKGRKLKAAKLLGWGKNTLTRKIKLLNIV